MSEPVAYMILDERGNAVYATDDSDEAQDKFMELHGTDPDSALTLLAYDDQGMPL